MSHSNTQSQAPLGDGATAGKVDRVKGSKRVLILAPFPQGYGPSQRFRLEIYFEAMRAAGLSYDYHTFLDEEAYLRFYDDGRYLLKAWWILKGFLRRFALLFKLGKYDIVFVEREASPLGPPIIEWLVARVFGKRLVYNIDDAIWIPNFAAANARFQKLKYYSKVDSIMRWSHRVIAGNVFIADRARLFNKEVRIIPTIVDTEYYHIPVEASVNKDSTIVLGWTGTHSTNKHLEFIAPVLIELAKTFDFKLLVISNKRPDIELDCMEYVSWSRETEIADLHRVDVGLMPLNQVSEFAKGKCGFKAIQFMAINVPVALSPVGVNAEIVSHGVNGFHCTNLDDWKRVLSRILEGKEDLAAIATRGRQTIVDDFSLLANQELFISVLTDD